MSSYTVPSPSKLLRGAQDSVIRLRALLEVAMTNHQMGPTPATQIEVCRLEALYDTALKNLAALKALLGQSAPED